MNGFTLPSFAKINWRLRVVGRRGDGFHELCTVFQTVSLHDDLTFAPSTSLSMECDDPRLPTGEENLVMRAARLLQRETGTAPGARISLTKRIPAPGGLGGGSSNAAVALLGLATLWNLDVSPERLVAIAAELGSDVPFFLFGGTASATGRGTEITPLADAREDLMMIVTPPVDVPTKEAFARLEAQSLTNADSKRILEICQNEAERFDVRQTVFANDFESSVYEFRPEVRRVRDRLLKLGARQAILCGSGASVFAVFEKEETRQATLKALEVEKDWRKFVVAAITCGEYRAALNKCERLFPISF